MVVHLKLKSSYLSYLYKYCSKIFEDEKEEREPVDVLTNASWEAIRKINYAIRQVCFDSMWRIGNKYNIFIKLFTIFIQIQERSRCNNTNILSHFETIFEFESHSAILISLQPLLWNIYVYIYTHTHLR